MSDSTSFDEPVDGFDDRIDHRLVDPLDDFTELIAFTWVTHQLIDFVLDRLMQLEELDTQIAATIPALKEQLPKRTVQLIGQLLGGEHADELNRHGLSDGHPEWQFKYAVFQAALRDLSLEASALVVEAAATGVQPDQGRLKRLLQKVRHPLKGANVILRSLAAATPAGGAFNEIKDGVEAAVDKVTDESGSRAPCPLSARWDSTPVAYQMEPTASARPRRWLRSGI